MKKEETKKLGLPKLKEMWKNKKGRAIIELSGYFIFFLIVLVLTSASGGSTKKVDVNNNIDVTSFLSEVKDNYECVMDITINDNIYNYEVKVLGNNASIVRTLGDDIKKYYIMNNKYYELDNNGNYILTTAEEVYPYISYNYLNINNIKTFIEYSSIEDNVYKIKVSDFVLNSDNSDEISISVNEENKSLDIDYTNVLKLGNDDITTAYVKMVFSNINTILSLEE